MDLIEYYYEYFKRLLYFFLIYDEYFSIENEEGLTTYSTPNSILLRHHWRGGYICEQPPENFNKKYVIFRKASGI